MMALMIVISMLSSLALMTVRFTTALVTVMSVIFCRIHNNLNVGVMSIMSMMALRCSVQGWT
jgi:hypothetical protein